MRAACCASGLDRGLPFDGPSVVARLKSTDPRHDLLLLCVLEYVPLLQSCQHVSGAFRSVRILYTAFYDCLSGGPFEETIMPSPGGMSCARKGRVPRLCGSNVQRD